MEYGNSAITVILSIISTLLAGVSIFQFIFFRKEKRRYEADTRKREEEAKQSEAGTRTADAEADSKIFANYRVQMDFFLAEHNKVLGEKFDLMNENFDLKQKMKEYDYKFASQDRKLSGMQKTIESSILRTKYAEDNICIKTECPLRVPSLGTFKHKEKEDERTG